MQMLQPLSLTLALALLAAGQMRAQGDSAIVTDVRLEKAHALSTQGRDRAFSNPAAAFFRQDYSLTTLGFAGRAESASALQVAPLGRGDSFWGFHADSHFVLDGHNRVWGEASYSRGERKEVEWCETSDFALLYPYVMADALGGSMDYEQYFLDGGYAGRSGRWIYGASLCYRARSEYRTKDPRPNNTVADLHAKAGAGAVLGHYALTASVRGGKYKQTNELKFFNELGAEKEYHLTGLGTEFVRFSGACNNVFYKGHNLGGSLELVPVHGEGLSLSAAYNRFSFEKILANLNRLPLNHLYEDGVLAEAVWKGHCGTRGSYGLTLDGGWTQRRGFDNLFGDATDNVYPQIGEDLMFRDRRFDVRLSGFYEHRFGKALTLGVSPFMAFGSYESKHSESGNTFETDQMLAGARLQGSFTRKRSFVELSLGASGRFGTAAHLRLNEEMACHPELSASLRNTARYLAGNEGTTRLGLYYACKLRPKAVSLFVDASWSHRFFLHSQHENRYWLTAGVCL